MITCGNTVGKGSHQHSTVLEVKRCYGLLKDPTLPTHPDWQSRVVLTGGREFWFGRKDHPDGPLSLPQYNYITDLKGDLHHALTLTYHGAHLYINELRELKYRKVEPVVTEAPDPRVEMIESLLPMVPDGYYAVQEYEGADVTFIRLSSPTRDKFKGSRKIQTIHGSGYSGSKMDTVAVHWPSKQWTWYKLFIKDKLLLLIADHQGAAMRYADKIGQCCRCNASLTDTRSRWYGIGPECEKYRPEHIEMVNVTKGEWHPGIVDPNEA